MNIHKAVTCLFASLLLLVPAVAAAEIIHTFDARYEIAGDGTVRVVERIEYDFEEVERHGIFRTLETDHPQPASNWLKKRAVAVEVVNVLRDGEAEPYAVTESSGEVQIKIGDPDRFLTGSHVYEIQYVLRGALSYGTDGAELYWNATGHNWPVTMSNVSIEVVPAALLVSGAHTCYQGVVGGSGRCTVSPTPTGAVFSAASVQPGEGVTIAQAVDATVVATLILEEWSIVWVLLLLLPLTIIGLTVGIYRRQTAHKPEASIIAQYEPYADLLPMYTGVIFDGRLDPGDITAGIVYLAEQGFIKIKRTEKKFLGLITTNDYELTLLRAVSEAPTEQLQAILLWIFSTTAKTESSSTILKISLSIKNALTSDDPVVVGKTVELSDLATRRTANHEANQLLQKVFQEKLIADAYFEKPLTMLGLPRGVFLVLLGVVTVVAIGVFVYTGIVVLTLLAVFVALVLLITSFTRRRTPKGYEARFHLLGFKDFLSVTDKERFAFYNAPEKSPELFMVYLPYAIALGVEKEWAKAFEGIAIPNPYWYDGGSLSTFSAAAFTSDLSSFATSFNASSGTSGSSGGGSSGGGGVAVAAEVGSRFAILVKYARTRYVISN